jgi:hypothetical protein
MAKNPDMHAGFSYDISLKETKPNWSLESEYWINLETLFFAQHHGASTARPFAIILWPEYA